MSSQSERLKNIKNKMQDLLESARQIVASSLDKFALEQADNSWFISIDRALDNDHDYYKESSITTMQDTITRLYQNEEQDKEDLQDKVSY